MNREEAKVKIIESRVPLEKYVPDCVDVDKFLAMCRQCPNYNKRWSCPDFDFDPMSIWAEYSTVYLIAHIITLEPGTSGDEAIKAIKAEKARFFRELLQLEKSYPGSMALSAGTCELCSEDCAKSLGKPCIRPESLRYSIEALGGDVGRTAEKYLGTTLQWISDDSVPEYMTTVGGLLLK